MLHCIGDSHVIFFSGNEHIPDTADYRDLIAFFKTYRLGPHTAYNAVGRKDLIEKILKGRVKPHDKVLFCFGEIDCRAHLLRQAEMQRRSVKDVVKECVGRYGRLFDAMKPYGFTLIAWGVPASSVEDVVYGEYSTYGNCRQRNEVSRLFNDSLQQYCEKNNIAFASIFEDLVDAQGLTKQAYYVDAIHLSQRAMPIALKALRDGKLLSTPLEAKDYTTANKRQNDGGELSAVSTTRTDGSRKSLLFYCGTIDLPRFISLRPNYDDCYVFSPDIDATDHAKSLFKNDGNVHFIQAPSLDLNDFCGKNSIDGIDKCVLSTQGNDLALLRTVTELIRKKKIIEVECHVTKKKISKFSKFLSEGYETVEQLPEKPIDGLSSVTIKWRLKSVSTPMESADPGRQYVFNVVYAHLKTEEYHSVHRGNVSVIWSRLPVKDCDLYLYHGAFSYTGRQKGMDVLFLHEPMVVLPGQYDKAVWERFDHIITMYDPLIENNERFTKTLITRSGLQKLVGDRAITEDMDERGRIYPLEGRINGLCMINGHKESLVPGELYSKRLEAALWFHGNSDLPCDVSGNPPFPIPNYKGVLPPDAKLSTLCRYRYNICFENTDHPVYSLGYVDKILSCLETRTIPIYLGTARIDAYVPRECLIDFRSFRNYEELDSFLHQISEEQYLAYIKNIDDFVCKGGLRPHSLHTVYDQLAQIYAQKAGITIAALFDASSQWQWGVAPGLKDFSFIESEGSPVWSWEYLVNTPSPLIEEKGSETEIISTSVDRLARKDQQNTQIAFSEYHAEIRELKKAIAGGSRKVDDHYRYAQLLIATEQHEESIKALHNVIDLDPEHTFAHNDLGVLYYLRKDHERAIEHYRKAFFLDRYNCNALNNLLSLLRGLERNEEMKQIAQNCLRCNPDDVQITKILEEYGLIDEAVKYEQRGDGDARQECSDLWEPEAQSRTVFEQIQNSGLWKEGQPLRLHLGCGENHFEGYINVDYPPSEHAVQQKVGADIFADITKMAFPDNSVDEIRLHHVFEHFSRPKTLALLIQWHMWLKVGGRLHIETPDIIGCSKLLVSPGVSYREKQALIRHLFGSQEASWAYHLDGWHEEKFAHTLTKLGFTTSTDTWRWQQEPHLANVVALGVKKYHMGRQELLGIAEEILLDSMVADVLGERKMHEVWCEMVKDELNKQAPGRLKMDDLLGRLSTRSTIKTDSPAFDGAGYDEGDIEKNGEANLLPKLIQDDDVVFDVGANKGLWSTHVLSLQRRLRLFAFEPVPETFGVLKKNINGNGEHASIFNMAISDEDREKTFYHYTNTSELAEMSTFFRRPDVEKTLGLDVSPILVEARTLDSFCREHSINHIHYLKIDTEGGEYDALKGASSLLEARRIDAIQFEYGGTFTDAKITLRQVCDFLTQFGYSIFRVLPDGLLHLEKWRDELESYRYSNYLALALNPDSPWKPMEISRKRTISVIFSKDRAMQLHGTLSSLLLHCGNCDSVDVKVLYAVSNRFHENAYGKVMKEFPGVEFVREHDFKHDLLSTLSTYDYVFFMVDDNIFVRDFEISHIVEKLNKAPRAIGFSLRLGKNTTYCYMGNKSQPLPRFKQAGDGTLLFEWTTSESDFGYPLEVSSSVYRVPDIFPLLHQIDFKNPNTLEALMDANKNTYQQNRPQLLCYEGSVTFCNPANKVQNIFTGNRGGTNEGYTADSLANAFLKGYRIDVEKYVDFIPNSCHQEVNYHFIRPNGHTEPAKDSIPLEMPLVTIGILNCNGLKHIKICLESIQRNTPEDHEIIIIDNGSTDGSVDYLRSLPNVTLIENPVNLGPTVRNQFLSLARGRYIVFLDNDTIVTKNWLTHFIEHAENDPEVGVIGACSNYASGLQGVQNTSYNDVKGLEEYGARRAAENRGVLLSSPRLVSFCLFLKRGVVEKIGGLDTSFGMFGFEDDDFSIRASIAGFKSVVAPDIYIHHTGGPQGRGDKQYNAWLVDAWEVFKRKWGLANNAEYGVYDVERILVQPFDLKRHYVPLPDRASVEKLIHNLPRYRERYKGHPYKVSDDTNAAEKHFKKSLLDLENGRLDSAIVELESTLAIDERFPEAHNNLGVLHYQKGDKQKALYYFSKAATLYPDNAESLKNLADLALELGEVEDAIGLYDHILAIDPDNLETLSTVGALCFRSGRIDDSTSFFNRILEIDPTNVTANEYVRSFEKKREEFHP